MSRGKRAAVTFLASGIVTISVMLLSFVTTPMLVEYLTPERWGVLQVVTQYVSYLSLFDFGLAGVLQVSLARALGKQDDVGVAAAVRAGIRASVLLVGVNACFLLALIWLSPHLIREFPEALTGELRLGLVIVLLGSVVLLAIPFRPLAEAQQRGHVVQAAVVAQAWIGSLLSVVFAAQGFGLPSYFLATAIGSAAFALILIWDGFRRFPRIVKPLDRTVELPATFDGRMFLHNLLGKIGLHSDGIILGLLTAPAIVTTFTLTQKLGLLAHVQILALGTATWAGLTEMHHQGHGDLFNARITQLTRWNGVFAFALLTPIGAFTGPFVTLWTSDGKFYGGDALAWTTVAYVWLQSLTALWGWPLVTTGRVRDVLPVYVVGIPLNLAISVWATNQFGMIGPAVGSLVSLAAVWSWWMPLLLRRAFGTPVRPLIEAAFWPVAVAIPYGVFLAWLAARSSPMDVDLPRWARWLLLAGEMSLGAMGYLVLAWFFVLPNGDRAEFRTRVFRR